jgi:membrane-anchored protein YejM (alkaline phosphatase superfamily)
MNEVGECLAAQSPATYTFAAHQSFFVGLLPNADAPKPYYNRFVKQLLGLGEVGEKPKRKSTFITASSDSNLVAGLRDRGFQTVGAGAMNWFRQRSLTDSFDSFKLVRSADEQVDFVLHELDTTRPFFAFINFGETHAPYHYRGKKTECRASVQARDIKWPPIESGPVGREHEGFGHQAEAVEYLDVRVGRLIDGLPANTVVVICGDHGECFGEDGYWGHGVNHPKVYEVPLLIGRLDGAEIE